ncbi:MAG: MerR family transcriptional regulator [Rubrivivax sp.]
MLKVGELARRTGLTVRTLHHYDQIGLLRPSGRSEGGYRLYAPADVARLHGIQALRRIGLPLDEIGAVLDADGTDLRAMVERQLRALDHEIAQATRLRERLTLLQAKYDAGDRPALTDWLDTLRLMTACDQYFSPAEVRLIFGNWHRIEGPWRQLMAELRALMDAGVPAQDARVQPLAHRWGQLMHLWMDGNFDLMQRWGRLYPHDPALRGPDGPDPAMVAYIEPVVQQRLQLMLRHLSVQDLHRLAPVPQEDWAALSKDVMALVRAGTAPADAAVRPLLKRWRALGRRASRGDDALWQRLHAAIAAEPALRQTAPLEPAARDFLLQAAARHAAPGRGA